MSSDERPLVSVVISFLNEERLLAEAVESVLTQTYDHWELLLVDDGSVDGSTAIARSYQELLPDRVRYLEHPDHANRGLSPSRNLGMREARGSLIALLDADDVWLPMKLERQVELLARNPEVNMVYGRPLNWRSWDPEFAAGRRDKRYEYRVPLDRSIAPPHILLNSYPLRPGWGAPCPSDLLFRRSVLDEAGWFEESFIGIYTLYEDQGFLAKVFLSQHVFVSDECWTRYRLRRTSVSAVVNAGRHYRQVRMTYLRWLRGYLVSTRALDPRVWCALSRATLSTRFATSASKPRRSGFGRFRAWIFRKVGGTTTSNSRTAPPCRDTGDSRGDMGLRATGAGSGAEAADVFTEKAAGNVGTHPSSSAPARIPEAASRRALR